MMNMKKITSFLMATIMVFSSLVGFTPQTALAATEIPATSIGDKPLTILGQNYVSFKYNGSNMSTIATGFIENGKAVYAYCMNPHAPGIGDGGARYSVSTSLIDNAKVKLAIENGYPSKTLAELGVDTVDQAYGVTKMACWAAVDPDYSVKANYSVIKGKEKPYNALMKLLDIVNGVTTAPKADVALTAVKQSEEIKDDGATQIQTFKVTDSGNPYTGSYKVILPSDTGIGKAVLGSIVEDTFTITITSIPPDSSGTFNIDVIPAGSGKKVVVYHGLPIKVTGRQDYAIAYEMDNSGSGTVDYKRDVKIIEEGGGGLTIRKLSSGTLKPLSGATFRLSKLDDPKAGVVGDFVTNTAGEITFPKLAVGAYKITEIQAPKGYLLDIVNVKNVTITAANQESQEVVFSNDETPKLKLLKTDTNTKPLQGVVFQIALDGGNETYTGITDSKGEIIFGSSVDLKPGSYSVTEVSVPQPYILDKTVKTVKLVAGKTTDVSFTNAKKPTWRLWKYIKGTSTLIDGAEFSIKNLDTNTLVWEGVVEDGMHSLDNLEPGWYRISEIATAFGYVMEWKNEFGHITTNYKDIKLEADKEVDIKFDNVKRPEVEIVKKDNFGKPVAGAIFKFKKADGSTQFEKMTDENGMIIVAYDDKDLILTEGVYEVTETKAPEGYIMAKECVQTVTLENGTRKTLTFVNTKKPTITILKIDAETKKPLVGAKFKITQTENKTIKEAITDVDGKITLTDLDDVIYTIEEITAPDGYILSSQHKDIKLKPGESMELVFENTKKPGITILKIDEETKLPLVGATFRIQQTENKTIKEAITDKDGKIYLTDLDDVIYSISEIIAPKGYILDPQHKDVKLKPGENMELVYTNKKKPTLRLQKVDANTGELLKNSEFKVTKLEDKTVSEYILENGEITLENLDEAIYRAEEFMAPEGYVIVKDTKEIALEWGKTKTLKFDNIRKPVIIFTKTNALTGKGIPGTKFNVQFEMANGGVKDLGSFTTDANGLIIIPKGEPGYYIFTETLPAPGYSKPSNPVTRKYFAPGENSYLPEFAKYYTVGTGKYASGYAVNDGTTTNPNTSTPVANEPTVPSNPVIAPTLPLSTSVEVHSGSEYATSEGFNWPLNSIVLKKADANTGELLAGAAIELYRADSQVSGQPGTQIGRYVTDASGVVVVVGLEPGYYVAKEVQAPPFYILAETSLQNGFLKADGTTVLEMTFRNYPYGSILVSKIDSVTGLPLANAKFKITDNAGAAVGNTTGEFITNAQGEALVEHVKPGSYVITEIKAPDNYAINTTPKTVQVGLDGKIYKISFDNYPYASILVSKVDGITGEPLANTKFKITDNDGKAVGNTTGEFTTDAKGEILVPNVAPGSYIVTELKAASNYAINTTPKTLQVGADGKVYKVSFENYPYGSILVSKIDGLTGKPLANATFKITDNDGKVVGNTTGEYISDSKGEILVPNVAPGSYVISEIKAPDNYAINTTPKTIEVGIDGKAIKASFENYPFGTLVLKKLDTDTKEPLANAEFKVITAKGDVVGTGNGIYKTDAKGEIVIPNLPKGSYVIEELKAPTGYVLANQTQTIAIDYGKSYTLEFFNKKMSSLQIIKIDGNTKQPLKDAKFNVYKMNGELLGQYTTNGEGLIILDTLTPGWYKVSEFKAPDGYLIDETAKDVEITGNQFVKLVFENQPMASVIIKKFDKSSKAPLIGAKFKVTKKSGDVVGEYTSDANGLVQLDNLAPGWYNAVEVAPPTGYKLIDQAQDFEVKHTKTVTLEFPNEKLTSLIIKKTDEKSGAPLAGAKFVVEKQNGEHIGDFTTDKDGTINIPTLAPDYYVIREKMAPEGYYLDESPKTVQVKTEVPTIATFTNKKLTALEIIKTDEKSGAPLNGAVFVIERQNGERIGEYTTSEKGIISIPTLQPDFYVVKEIKAPDGYLLETAPKVVEVKTDVPTVVKFTNRVKSGFQIIKIDAKTGTPLPGAKFTVYKKSGEVVGEFTTDNNGVIILDNLDNGWYKLAVRP